MKLLCYASILCLSSAVFFALEWKIRGELAFDLTRNGHDLTKVMGTP